MLASHSGKKCPPVGSPDSFLDFLSCYLYHTKNCWTLRARKRISSVQNYPLVGPGLPAKKLSLSFYLFIYSYKFIYLFLFLAALGLCCCARVSLVAASGGYSLLRCEGFSLWWLLLLRSTGSRHAGFSSCSTQAQ